MAETRPNDSHPNRRILLAGAAAMPALAIPAQAGVAPDPTLAAYAAWKAADAASIAAYVASEDETPGNFVVVPTAKGERTIAHSAEQIDQIIKQQVLSAAFDGIDWIDPTPAQRERLAKHRARPPYTAPDAADLKAQLADNIAADAEIKQRHRVDELRDACVAAQKTLIDTPATSFAGIAAKCRFELTLSYGDPDCDVIDDDPTARSLLSIMNDAERLAAEGLS